MQQLACARTDGGVERGVLLNPMLLSGDLARKMDLAPNQSPSQGRTPRTVQILRCRPTRERGERGVSEYNASPGTSCILCYRRERSEAKARSIEKK